MSRVNAVILYVYTMSDISVNWIRLISINFKINFDTNIANPS